VAVIVVLVCLLAITAVQAVRPFSQPRFQQSALDRSTYVYANGAAQDLPLGKSIQAAASNEYTVPLGTTLYHATTGKFPFFNEVSTWFSLDPYEGWRMIMQKAALNNVDAFVRKVTAARNLKLFLMKRTQAQSQAALLALGAGAGAPWFAGADIAAVNGNWYGLTSAAASAVAFIEAFCRIMQQHAYDGWRNPWDQDEIMVCPVVANPGAANVGTTIASKIVYGAGGWICPRTKWQGVFGLFGDNRKYYSAQYLEPPAAGGNTNRLHYIILERALPLPVGVDAGYAADQTATLWKKGCCAWDAQWRAYEQYNDPTVPAKTKAILVKLKAYTQPWTC